MAELGASLFAMIMLLVIAVMLQPLAWRTQIPHSVLLTVVGIVVGITLQQLPEDASFPGSAYLLELDSLGISAEAIFYLLLIPMVFDSAARINVRYLIDDLGPITLLAVAGTLFTVSFVGYSLHWATGAGLVACLLIGAICSSTDPLPIQEVFENMGVPRRVDLLVEGESLFADSTALVAYALLLGMLTGTEDASFSAAFFSFLEVSIGGAVIGYLLSLFFCFLISLVASSVISRNTLAVCLAYTSYYIVEEVLGYSGVVAVLIATFVLSTRGKAHYSPTSWQAFLDSSGQVNFIAKTIVFMLVGMVAPMLISSYGLADLWMLVIVFLAASIARAAVIFGLLPIMSSAGVSQPVSGGIKTIMFWGSSRGAISLALALAIIESEGIDSELARFIATVSTAFVLATIFVNATTMQPLLRLLKLNRLDRLDIVIKDRALFDALTELSDEIREQMDDARDQTLLSDAVQDFDGRARVLFDSMTKRADLDNEEWKAIGLTALAQYEQRIYLKYQENRLISPANARILLTMVGDLIDGVRHHGSDGYYGATTRSLHFLWPTKLGIWVHRTLGSDYILRQALASRFEKLYTLVLVMEEIDANADTRVAKLVYRDVMDDVTRALGFRLDSARDELAALQLAYPNYVEQLEQNLHKLSLARLELQKYQDLLDQALISAEVFAELQQEVEERIFLHSRAPKLDLELEVESALENNALLRSLPEELQEKLTANSKAMFTRPGEKLLNRGDVGNSIFCISSGAVRVETRERSIVLGAGQYFGEMALLRAEPRNADVYSHTYCRLLEINCQDFRELIDGDSDLRSELEHVVRVRSGLPR